MNYLYLFSLLAGICAGFVGALLYWLLTVRRFTFDYVREDAVVLIQQMRAVGCRRAVLVLTDKPQPPGIEYCLIKREAKPRA